MKHVVPAKRLVAELAREERIEARRPEAVGRDLAKLIGDLGRPPSGRELEAWLEEHRMVGEVFVGANELDELVHRHLADAFPRPDSAQDAYHPEIEQEIRNAPGCADPHLVYADWLQENSDPMGQLIAYGVAATEGGDDDVAKFERYLKLHRDRFLADLYKHMPTLFELKWRYGLVREIHAVGELGVAMWQALLGLRVCQFIEAVTIMSGNRRDQDAAVAAITEHAAQSLRSLTVHRFYVLSVPQSLLERNLEKLVARGHRVTVPDVIPESLDTLELQAGIVECPGDQPRRWRVRELAVLFTVQNAELLAEVELAKLERLTLLLGEYNGSDAELTVLLRGLQVPAIEHLGLSRGRIASGLLPEIAKLPMARQLRSLALTHLGLSDEAAGTIAEHLSRFESLGELDVTGNELSRQGLAALQAVVPHVVSRRQEPPGTAAHADLRAFAGSRLRVAQRIADPRRWRRSGQDGDIRWARYRGTDEYELFVTRDLRRYGCSCPSGIQPCKHVVALALVAEKQELKIAPSDGIEHRVAANRVP